MELYKKHRPKKLEDIVGQVEAVKVLTEYIKEDNLPHAILFIGPSGSGKTTFARILKKYLGCLSTDFVEMDCADARNIDDVRFIKSQIHSYPTFGRTRVWLLDEVQSASNYFQEALLKILEDTPPLAYFMLATTDPQKLKRTVKGRCTNIKLNPVSGKALEGLITKVVKLEKAKKLHEDVLDKIIDTCNGSAREALVLLESVIKIEDMEEQLSLICSPDVEKEAVDICRVLMNTRAKWMDVAAVLKNVRQEPEKLRHIILAWFSKVMLGGGKLAPRAFLVLDAFSDPIYDVGAAGRAKLYTACYEVVIGEST